MPSKCQRGVVTLPKDIRDRYDLATDTPLTLVDWDGVLLLSSRIPVVTEIARQLAAKPAENLSIEDLLAAWAQDRQGADARQGAEGTTPGDDGSGHSSIDGGRPGGFQY